ncbi:MAG: rRNA pseudouridine synthase [Clostridiales bacterium]|nr:rRNA pseudouridine synthase [Clostridiales bacterium]
MDKHIEERLQKILARTGVASRRAAEKMIQEGRVQVNGQIVRELGAKACLNRDKIYLDGCLLAAESKTYILLHKPAGFITSVDDPKGRRTVLQLIPEVKERVYPVGRLDYATSGLLLLTNDGPLTHAMLHPAHQVDKTYHIGLAGKISEAHLQRLRQGIRLEDGLTAPAKARIVKKEQNRDILELVVHEGRNRQVRRMLEALGQEIIWLKRIRLAFLELGSLKPGEWRYLELAEIKNLYELMRGSSASQLTIDN